MNVRLIKSLDSVIGHILASTLFRPSYSKLPSPVTSILFIRPGGIGDAVLLAPSIRFLKKLYPAINITVLAEKRNAGVFSLIPEVDRLLCYDRPFELMQALCSRYDVVIDTEQWHRFSAVVAWGAMAPHKIGFDTNERRRLFTHPIPYSHDDYEVVSFAHLLEPLGIEAGAVEMGPPFLVLTDADSDNAANLLDSLHDKPFATLFPGASIPERRWGADCFRRVAEMLSASGIKVVVVGGGGDKQQGEVIVQRGLGLNLAGLTSLAETAAVIQKSSLLVSGDSGLLHIAVGLGTPTVSLFGPGRTKKWAPQSRQNIVINKELPCSPCTTFGTTPPCAVNACCMHDIAVDDVVNAVNCLLRRLGLSH